MELHIKDRIFIPQLLPQQGSFADFNLKRSIIGKVAISDDDRKEYGIAEDKEAGKVTWDAQKDSEYPLIVEFTSDEIAYMRKACESMADGNYPDDVWRVVEKIYNQE